MSLVLKSPQLGNNHFKKTIKHMNSWKALAAFFPANIVTDFYG